MGAHRRAPETASKDARTAGPPTTLSRPPRQWALTANCSSSDGGACRGTQQQLAAAKWEHAETTSALKRALQVTAETTQVAQDTLSNLYHQGQQVERAAYGVEQIEGDAKHARRMVRFMGHFCCFRNSWNDSDVEREQHRATTVQQQRMAGVVASEGIAASYAAKQELVQGVVAKRCAAADAAAASAVAGGNRGASASDEPWSELIAAVPGPLGRLRAQERCGAPMLGHGLPERDRRHLQAETAQQEVYLEQLDSAMDTLKVLSLAMGQELEQQAPQLDELQQWVDATGRSLRSVAAEAAKLAGCAPSNRRGSASSWAGERDAATQVMARAVVATGPVAAAYAR